MKLPARKTCPAYPSYAKCAPRSKQTSETKRRNRARGTAPEILLAGELKKRGISVSRQSRGVVGTPDFILSPDIAVFCDGDFWHGRQWHRTKGKLERGHNAEYWCRKIEANIKRDKDVNNALRRIGWTVLRFWETNIRRNPAEVVRKIIAQQK